MEAQPQANNNNGGVLDLSAYMTAPTVNVPKPDFDAQPVDQTNPDDFTEDDTQEEASEPEAEKSYKDFLADATLFINLFDGLQTGVLKPVYRAKMLESDDLDIINRWTEEAKQIKAGKLSEHTIDTDEFLDAVNRNKAFVEVVKTIPFNPAEKKRLQEPLAKVIQKHQNLTVSPETALILAVLIVMAPRIIQVLPDSWGNKLSSVFTLGLLKNATAE